MIRSDQACETWDNKVCICVIIIYYVLLLIIVHCLLLTWTDNQDLHM